MVVCDGGGVCGGGGVRRGLLNGVWARVEVAG